MISEVFNCDCMEYMKTIPNKFFELAIVDPPYGIGQVWSKNRRDRFFKKNGSYLNDKIPKHKYFRELFRVSKNQIIFGYNYFTHILKNSNNLIIWDKIRDVEDTFMSEVEIAWHSFKTPAQVYKHQWNGCSKATETGIIKIHPFQKPVNLYRWILNKYSKPGDKILDTHVGSGSSRIACFDMGVDFYGTELDSDYFKAMEERFFNHTSQKRLFYA